MEAEPAGVRGGGRDRCRPRDVGNPRPDRQRAGGLPDRGIGHRDHQVSVGGHHPAGEDLEAGFLQPGAERATGATCPNDPDRCQHGWSLGRRWRLYRPGEPPRIDQEPHVARALSIRTA